MYISLIVSEKCNFNCDYCYFTGKNFQKTIDLDTLKKYSWLFDIINGDVNFNISVGGGDPGFVKQEVLKQLFSSINQKVIISCEDKFIENDYHIIFDDYISVIYYHISDLKKDVKINNITEKMILGIVDEDIIKIDNFFKNNKIAQKIQYIDIENNINVPITIEKIKERLLSLIKVLKKYNADQKLIDKLEHKNNLKNKYLEDKRNNCYKHFNLNINLVQGKIFKCFRDYNDSIELTEQNFKKILMNDNIFHYTDVCKTCSRVFMHITPMNILERINLIKEINV